LIRYENALGKLQLLIKLHTQILVNKISMNSWEKRTNALAEVICICKDHAMHVGENVEVGYIQ
jgi:hypothetical protein